MTLLITVEGDNAYGLVILTCRKDAFQHLYDLLSFRAVSSVYPLTVYLMTLNGTLIEVLGYVGRDL